MTRKAFAFVAVALLMAGPVDTALSQPSLDEPFELTVGQSKVVGDQGLQIGFAGILGDSRCPLGVECIWEGDAAAHIWADQPSGPREDLELHTNTQFQRAAVYEGYKVTLLGVAPYPDIEIVIDPNDYVVTVVVTSTAIPSEETTWGRIKALFAR